MKRRDLLKISALSCFAAVSGTVSADAVCIADGTPDQFIPKKSADAKPLDNEFEKYPTCPYCGMDRKENHLSRMLVQYSDNLSDGVCSIRCLSLSLGINLDREPKNIWGPDYGARNEPRPLMSVDSMTYLIDANLDHNMTRRSKHSFALLTTAKEFQSKYGGSLGNFDDALRESYLDMAADYMMIRKMRAERDKHAEESKKG